MTTATQQPSSTGRRSADPRDYHDTSYRAGGGDPTRVARGLGWFSIGLGLAEIAAPRSFARLIGVDDDDSNRNTIFAYGVREIASGVGILAGKTPAVPVWARVGGDAMDLAFLGRQYGSGTSRKNRVAAATAAVVGVTVLDLLTGRDLSRLRAGAGRNGSSHRAFSGGSRRGGTAPPADEGVEVRRAITIGKPPEEIYRFWRDFTNLPQFMEHLESVQVQGDRRSHWKARAPAGTTVEWDAEITEDRPNELIAWRSVEPADVPNTGSVRFTPAPGGRGTEILVELRYDPPGGKLGAFVAKLFGEEPGQQVHGDLRRLKQVMETGEVMRSDASIHHGMHPAQPSAAPFTEGAGR